MDSSKWKVVPVEPTPEMMEAADDRVGRWQHEESRSAYAAMLAAAPQPPSASDKRIRLPKLPEELYEHYVSMSAQTHEAAVKSYARAALAPSPGVDAAEQKPVGQIDRKPPYPDAWWSKPFTNVMHLEGMADLPHGTLLYAGVPPAPSTAASADEWMTEAERLLRAYVAGRFAYIARPDAEWPEAEHAALLAHLKAHP